MTFSRMRSLAQNEMSLKNTEEKKISIQFSNEIKSSQYNFIKLPLELIVPRINYLEINELLQQQNVIFRRLLSALNIDRRHFCGSHAIARPKFSRHVNSNMPQNIILPGLMLTGFVTQTAYRKWHTPYGILRTMMMKEIVAREIFMQRKPNLLPKGICFCQ